MELKNAIEFQCMQVHDFPMSKSKISFHQSSSPTHYTHHLFDMIQSYVTCDLLELLPQSTNYSGRVQTYYFVC
ncbi:MAG: hypothetical protein ACI8RD_001762 [Bacillariaceae sp.]|jgi:hypothetical protein